MSLPPDVEVVPGGVYHLKPGERPMYVRPGATFICELPEGTWSLVSHGDVVIATASGQKPRIIKDGRAEILEIA